MRTALVTGSSGFIGFHLCQLLLADGFRVVGLDNLSDYYDVELKRRRQSTLLQDTSFSVVNDCLETPGLLADMFGREKPEVVVHLAAQAGVGYSIKNPRAYLESNIAGTFELLEAARAHPPDHLLLASTSSIYGANTVMPYSELHKTDHQVSFYAATKKANEAMSHSYSHLFGLPVTMFRFFTVYGPWGRPDMALFKFTKAILENKPIDVNNGGDMRRDFTYVTDLVHAIRLLIDKVPVRPTNGTPPEGDSLSPVAPWRVVNIGNTAPVSLTDFISAIESATGLTAIRNLLPMPLGEVPATWADSNLLKNLTGYTPTTDIRTGVKDFVDWYRDYYGVDAVTG
ncbi:NAD-dependent epimerase/dehydratase family protein [Mycolicibacterium sp. 018/SC-01/001]|uniref:NAD-dependent epimerase/dehydratase family protein n=1 Tax=Mycolicibacterium sp. 018/SC-01/001 TaxID=2592069 RepID=UPI00117D1F0C|nr:NAD-dependent epimerase/dehydratase family protein [Mycolicibacterium sp. 018/SC-01/001]TRW80463.1 NAD-dependent epimerase/dehydratase family protein [Mycolicibacterium sp. 018/SC-01/001]